MAEKLAQRDWRPHNSSTRVILASLAALAALLVAWFAPLPRLVLSDEEKAAARMPDDRAAVTAAQSAFQKAETAYKSYVSTNDVGAALDGLDHAVQIAKATPADLSLRAPIQTTSLPVLSYLSQLQAYAQAGETYFGALSHYDDELMAWTRSLGSESDALQSDTWPIVEYLKVYPPPVGEIRRLPKYHSSPGRQRHDDTPIALECPQHRSRSRLGRNHRSGQARCSPQRRCLNPTGRALC